ncbi:HD domain-containing protein [bacterium]|nr:MAG: HD domain-containing protein [bacterium]
MNEGISDTPFPSAKASAKLTRRLRFLLEADKLRLIERQTYIGDNSRRENSAEHSWHLALSLLLFSDAAHAANVNLERAIQIALVHDLVEIYAGDTFVYADAALQLSRIESERAAAERLFGMLDEELGAEFRAIWEEYEFKTSPEARFVGVFDRLCPMLLNFTTHGHAWRANGVSVAQVRERSLPDLESIPELHAWTDEMLNEAVELGFLKP